MVKDQWAKVKGHITTIPPCNTPLSLNTSSLQIPIQILHSFRRYRAEGNFRVEGHWAKVKGHRAMITPRDTPLPPTTLSQYQCKIFIRSGYRAEGNFRFKVTAPRAKVTSPQFHHATHLCSSANTNPKSAYVQEIQSRS
jgi:hypothetical protein